MDAYLHYHKNGNGECDRVWGYGVIHGTTDRADGCGNHESKVEFGNVNVATTAVINKFFLDWQSEHGKN